MTAARAAAKSDFAALLDRAEWHLRRGDTAGLRDDVESLAAGYERSSGDERVRFSRLHSRILGALRAGLPLEQFLKVAGLGVFAPWEVYRVLDPTADDLDLEEIFAVVAALGMPSQDDAPIRARLAASDDPRIVPWLDAAIRESAVAEEQHGKSLSHHQRTMSSFQFVRWHPDDEGLSAALEVLAARPEPGARACLHRYLEELPWGPDRRATATLLHALVEGRSTAGEEAVRRALDHHTEPGPLRLYLIQALAVWSRPDAVGRALDELGRDLETRTRFDLLQLLDQELEKEEEEPVLDVEAIAERLDSLDTTRWSRLERGALAGIGDRVPGVRTAELAGAGDRFVTALVGSFQVFRLDHMGCMITLPLTVLLFWGASWVLDRVLAPPSPGLAVAQLVILGVWLLVLAGTSSTHFSGHEGPRDQLVMATVFWGTTLAVAVVLVGTRLASMDLTGLRPLVLPATAVLAGLCLAVPLARHAPRFMATLLVLSAVAGAVWFFASAEHVPGVALWAAQVATAAAGAFLTVLITAAVAGTERFSLPFDQMTLVVVLVGALAPWYGWSAVGWVVGGYTVLGIVLGLAERLGA